MINAQRLAAVHRKLHEVQALLRAVQFAQEGIGEALSSCMKAAHKILEEIDHDLYALDQSEADLPTAGPVNPSAPRTSSCP